MFRASLCPSSEATTTAVAASDLPSKLGDNSAVGRGRAGQPVRPRPTALLHVSALFIRPPLGNKSLSRKLYNI
jgi:hypothetical protein